MQKRAYSSYFASLPVESGERLYFDKDPVELPYAEDFPNLHYHDRYEIGACIEGQGLFLSEGRFSTVRPGDLIFVAPENAHYSRSLNPDEPCICRFVYLKSSWLSKILFSVLGDEARVSEMIESARAFPAVLHRSKQGGSGIGLSDMIAKYPCEEDNFENLVALRLAEFIIGSRIAFGEPQGASEVKRVLDEAVAKVSAYISLRYNENHTAKELSAICHLSESQLRRRFLQVYGITPIAYKNRLRCEIAGGMLCATSLSVGEISERIGYSAPSDFYRAFTKIYGISPSVYRSVKQLRS